MTQLDYLPLIAMPLVAGLLGFLATDNLFERPGRILLGALAALVAFGIGQVSVNKAKRDGYNWLQLAYVWFAIMTAAGFIVQHVIGSETAWPAALALTFALHRLYGAAVTSGSSTPPSTVLRGPQLSTFEEIQAKQHKVVPPGKPFYLWGGLPIPKEAAFRHFMVVGSTGSGKTTSLRMLMQQALPEIQPGSRKRAFVYDAKGDMTAILAHMGLTCPIINMNPYDERGHSWKICDDISEPADIDELAALLYPDPKGSDKEFFVDSPRLLISSFVHLFKERQPAYWTLRDIICAGHLSHVKMQEMFDVSPDLRHQLQNAFAAPEFPSMAISVSVKLAKFATVAACWEKHRVAKRELSLTAWPNDESILLVPSIAKYSKTLEPLNNLIVRRLGDVLLSEPDDDSTLTWVFLDEFASLGYMETLPRLIREGRSKGVAVVLGFQGLGGLHDPKRGFGEEATKTILEQIHTRAFLQILDPGTREWASQCLMENEQLITLSGWSGNQATKSEQLVTSRLVLPAEFKDFPVCVAENGLHGWYSSTDYKEAWNVVIPAKFWPPKLSKEFQREHAFRQLPGPVKLERWTTSDLIRLKLPLTLIDDNPPKHIEETPPDDPNPQSDIFGLDED